MECVTRFFDASILRYPSSFSYPSSYETRMLTPVANYEAGTTTFTTIDISSSISHNRKFAGGVLSPNGLIFFIPFYADVIGKVQLSNTYPSYKVEGGLAESWKALLSPYFNKF